ncbi:MAG: peptide chain release factor-like protein [Thermodesulfobacteriota bacterium]|nr:peptide chain release factor-like protein [Thermodesulfobacteriota bacterium]
MIQFPVSEEKNRALRERMEALGIHEKDIEERFIRSSGRGGQKVNKTSTCVYLKHLPTGIEVKWMTERSQALNRFFARRELVTRMERLTGQVTDEDLEIKKLRRKKSKRKKRAGLKYHRADL